jgi:hypothetical protein
MTLEITIPIPKWLESRYAEASDEEREQIKRLIIFLIDAPADEPEDSETAFPALMDRIGNNALARGLTPEILASILNERDHE